MLVRIVRMTFQEEKVEDFLKVFEATKDKIKGFDGCEHLELHKDYHEPNIFVTYSIWRDDRALNGYRYSELFEDVWSKTKPLFKEKPVAFSNKPYIKVS